MEFLKVNALQEDSRYPSLFTSKNIQMRNKGQIHGKTKRLNEDLEKGWFIVDCKMCEHGKLRIATAWDVTQPHQIHLICENR